MTDEGDTRSRAKRDSDVVATWHFRRRHVALLVALASAPNGLVAYRAYSDKPAETREESRQGREAIARQVRAQLAGSYVVWQGREAVRDLEIGMLIKRANVLSLQVELLAQELRLTVNGPARRRMEGLGDLPTLMALPKPTIPPTPTEAALEGPL